MRRHADSYETLIEEITKRVPNDFFVRNLPKPEALHNEDQNSITLRLNNVGTSQPCNVAKNGTLEVFLRPSSVLQTETFVATIEKEFFFLKYPDGSPYKVFSLNAIQMPLETLSKTRECFRLYYKSAPFGFCGRTTTERDSWMNSLTEAHEIKPTKLDAGEAISLNPISTKNQRWKKMLADDEKAVKNKQDENEILSNNDATETVNEIEVTGLLEGKPNVFVNGEKLPLFLDAKQDVDSLIDEEENENKEIETSTS